MEAINDLRFRVVISHSRHFLKRLSGPMGRSLSLLLRELHIAQPVWGTPRLLGVRDFMGLVGKWFNGNTVLVEKDIDNTYWELPKEGVFEAVREAAAMVKKHRGMRGEFYFSIARGGERLLDHLGEAADRNFRTVPLRYVLQFVWWDLDHNTLFGYQGWVLSQNLQCVPIGGLLSAQLMCLWALIKR